MTTVPLYTSELLNSQNQLEIGLLNHLTQQVRMVIIFNIEIFMQITRSSQEILL